MAALRSSRAVAVAFVTFATFTDIVAYSIAVPVLPDLSRRLGASPTMIGFLFASFGVTLLTVSLPMGAVSDRIGRKAPMVGGLVGLAAATLLFAFATTLPWLFAARMVQGAADAITWVVGFALIADLYGDGPRSVSADEIRPREARPVIADEVRPREPRPVSVDEVRPQSQVGKVTGIVMSGTSFAFMIGPSIGGWLYELGGMRLPFLAVTVLAVIAAAAFAWLDLPRAQSEHETVPLARLLRAPAVAACVVGVIAASSTLSMLEPVVALHLATLSIGPARIGLLFGIAAVVNASLHPLFGRMADRWGSRRMMLLGLALSALALVLFGQTWSFRSTMVLQTMMAASMALMITPSLVYMAEATSQNGAGSFGVAYGLYNMAWGAGLLGGPALGGFLFERMGFGRLVFLWGPALVAITLLLARVQSDSSTRRALF